MGLRNENKLVVILAGRMGAPVDPSLYVGWLALRIVAKCHFSTNCLTERRIKAGQKNGVKS